jgi:hypothetical protein
MSKPSLSPVEPVDHAAELARLREDLIAFYRPVSSQERFAVERIALAQQSMLRAATLETSLFAASAADLLKAVDSAAFRNLLRFQDQAERAYRRAVEEFLFLKSRRSPAVAAQPPVLPARTTAPIAPPRIAVVPRPAPPQPVVCGNLALRL